MAKEGTAQIGKQGITENFINSLKNQFKAHDNVRVSALKSFTRDRKKIKECSEKIIEELGKNYTYRLIGFTIVLKKWRKNVR